MTAIPPAALSEVTQGEYEDAYAIDVFFTYKSRMDALEVRLVAISNGPETPGVQEEIDSITADLLVLGTELIDGVKTLRPDISEKVGI